jgi:hypothetical protein
MDENWKRFPKAKVKAKVPTITQKLIDECNEWRRERMATVREWCDSKGYDRSEFLKAVGEWEEKNKNCPH